MITGSDVMSLISTVGFPIVAYGALFVNMQKENKAHREQIDKFSESFNANTQVIAKLLERMDNE